VNGCPTPNMVCSDHPDQVVYREFTHPNGMDGGISEPCLICAQRGFFAPPKAELFEESDLDTEHNTDTERARCDAWVGLEPPESADCGRPSGHTGPHKAGIRVSQRTETGEYNTLWADLVCPAHSDGSETP